MSRIKGSKNWTETEKNYLICLMAMSTSNLSSAYEEASEKLGKSIESCKTKGYRLLKDEDVQELISSKKDGEDIKNVKNSYDSKPRWTEDEDFKLLQCVLDSKTVTDGVKSFTEFSNRTYNSAYNRYYYLRNKPNSLKSTIIDHQQKKSFFDKVKDFFHNIF